MKYSFQLIAALIVFASSLGVNSLKAQQIEGGPGFTYVFTPIFDENANNPQTVVDRMPGELLNAVKPAVAVAPNPSVDEVMMVWYNQIVGTSKVEVLNLRGQVQAVAMVGEDSKRAGRVQFDVSAYGSGVYFVRLTSGIYTSVKKIVVN